MNPNYILNLFRIKKFGTKNLVVTDQGQWIFLDDALLSSLSNGNLQEGTSEYDQLEKHGIIVTEDNESGIVKRLRNNYLHIFTGTSLHIIVPTIRCNYKCAYCHSNVKPVSSTGFDMDKETARKTVDFIFQSPSQAITIEFQGGEPLLKFDILQEIISYAKNLNKTKKRDLRIDLVSNLSLMDHDILKYLIKENVGICTSLDGPEPLHNKNRIFTGGSSYKETTYWIDEIKSHYNYPLNALMVTTRHSLPYAKEIVDEYRKHNFHWIRLRHLDSLGFAQNNKNIHYSAQEYLTFWKSAMDYLVSVNKDHFMAEGFIQLIMRKLKGENPFYSDFQSPCGAILNQLAYSYNGDIYTCDEGRQYDLFKLGNVFSHSYKEIVQSDQSCAMISSSVTEGHLCDACVYKPFCGICPVCIYSEENNLIPKLAKNQRCMIYKGIFDYLFSSFTQPAHKKTFFSWINEKV